MPVDERALSDAQLLEMMGLLKGSDTVELKVTIPARGARSVVASLGMDPMDAQPGSARSASSSRRSSVRSTTITLRAGPSLDDLSILGPVYVLKLKQQPEGFPRKIVGEMWLYPDGKRIVELSMKCMPQEAFQVAAESRAFFAERGIDMRGEQQMKTKTALEFFSKELAAQA